MAFGTQSFAMIKDVVNKQRGNSRYLPRCCLVRQETRHIVSKGVLSPKLAMKPNVPVRSQPSTYYLHNIKLRCRSQLATLRSAPESQFVDS